MIQTLLCCDWGTSSFRLRLVDTLSYQIITENQSSEGVATTFGSWQAEGSTQRFEFYASCLKTAINVLATKSEVNLSGIPLIVSGMASSSIGMEEVPYASVPFSIDGSNVSSKIFQDFNGEGSSLTLVSGVKTGNDVMRGEEAQLIGLFKLKEFSSFINDNSIFVFPGTHSKHMRVDKEILRGFQTFMTGEMYNLLSEHSILRDSIESGGEITEAENQSSFSAGIEASGSSNLLNSLFAVRTNQLFSKFTKGQNAFFLSGLLIGTELRQLATQSYSQLIICSGRHLYEPYRRAAEALNFSENIIFIEPDIIDKATIAGQVQIFKALNNSYE